MTIKRILFVSVTLCFIFSPQISTAQTATAIQAEMEFASPQDVGMSAEKLAKVVPALQALVDDQKVAGAIVIVARHGKLVLHDSVGWRDIEAKEPMETDSILRFYSMTKAITSVSVMMLVEEGKISLDDAVETYVPELGDLQVFSGEDGDHWKLVNSHREMTIRDLLRHTSGFTYGFFG